ncbi:MAG: AAA family ATPase [Flavobacteriaceae bacterium]|nr:AAA family ATPase [Flavobacteriaceae bacterium]
MNFKRHILHYLLEWKSHKNRKPLVLRGARQVGKTTLVEQFSKTYKHSILINLEKPEHRRYFEDFDDVKIIIESLFLSNNISSSEIKHTLLFLDEIQESPKAIQLLRYFYEELPELHVIAAGSLLEFAMHRVKSFPVGRIEYLYMYPLNFREYLLALDHKTALEQLNHIPVKPFAHKILLDLFNRYAIIGGMPEVIKTYILNQNISDLPRIYESIWGTYKNDVEKYTTNETERKVIKHIISTAHLYLDQRIKFQNFGNSNYKSREVGEAMRNLDEAKIIQLIYPTTDVEPPIKSDLKKSPRLQFLDTGLVNHALDIQAQMLGMHDLSTAFKGAVIPHLITQEILSLNTISSKKTNFWVREKRQATSEVDLVISHKGKVIPIEIKSGSTGSLKSLHQFMERANHPYAIRMYAGEFSIEETKTPGGTPYFLMNLPYYLGTKIPEYIDFFF